MATRGRAMGEAMRRAVEDLKANPDQYLRDVAERHGARLSNLRTYVERNDLKYKKRFTRVRPPEEEQRRLSQPAYRPTPEEQRVLTEMHKAALERETGEPVDVRARRQLRRIFERLEALWGPWIKN